MKLQEISNEIKIKRKEKKLTQEELAKNVGISRVTLGKLERGEWGNISVKTLDLILSYLNLELDIKENRGFGLPTLDSL